MPNDPQDDDTGDIDPADLDDLGDLDGPDEDEDDEQDEAKPKGKPIPDAEAWAKIQRKMARQEERITRLTGKRPGGKPVADVDKQLAKQLGKTKDEDDEPADTGETARWRDIAIRNAASAQISAAGFSGTAKQAARLAKLIDTSDLEPDRNGTFDLEDEIEELMDEYPALFSQQTGTGRRAPVVRRADSKERAPKDPTRATSDALMKQAGYR